MKGRSQSGSNPKGELQNLGYSPLKRFGQNFLADEAVINKIIDVITKNLDDSRVVFEIGPGLGCLTHPLLDMGCTVKAFEIDKGLCAVLRRMSGGGKLEIIEGDALKTLFSGKFHPYVVCGNLPYNMGTVLIARVLETGICGFYPDRMIFLLQREVAEKLSLAGGSSSSLGILASLSYDCELIFDVPSESFFPPPKVVSSLVALKRKEQPVFYDDSEKADFMKLVRSLFLQKRKTIKNNLLNFGAKDPDSLLHASGISPLKRAQELTLDDFLSLSKQLAVANDIS